MESMFNLFLSTLLIVGVMLFNEVSLSLLVLVGGNDGEARLVDRIFANLLATLCVNSGSSTFNLCNVATCFGSKVLISISLIIALFNSVCKVIFILLTKIPLK